MNNLVARFAENVFWFGRYMERAENLARILDVNETFARDAEGGQEWLPVLQLNADEARFFAKHRQPTAANILYFYLLDRDNPTSLLYSIGMARENARALRHLISTEMWTHLNVFHHRMRNLKRHDIRIDRLSRLCNEVKEGCQAHAGIAEGTLYRDEAWCFYSLGKFIERADQTSRLLDIKYQRLASGGDDPGSPVNLPQWNALVRSVAGYQAFRRAHRRTMRPEDVAAFLIFDPSFPRSMNSCIQRVRGFLDRLEQLYGLPTREIEEGILADLLKSMQKHTTRSLLDEGLHKFVDRFQFQLTQLSTELGRRFFGHDPEEPK